MAMLSDSATTKKWYQRTWLAVAMLIISFPVGLFLIVFSTAANSPETASVPDSAGDVGRYTSLQLDADEYPVVSYYERTTNGDDLKILHCQTLLCDGADSITTLDTALGSGAGSSLELDSQGFPVVSYSDGSVGDLKLLRCDDPLCSGGGDTITIVDSAGLGGGYSSLALDVNDNPVISYDYHDGTYSNLKVVHCGDPTCTAGNVFATPYMVAGSVAGGSAIVLDASGNPAIAFRGASTGIFGNTWLGMLSCGDPNCQSGNSIGLAGGVVQQNTAGVPTSLGGQYLSLVLDSAGLPVLSHFRVGDSSKAFFIVTRCATMDCGSKTSTTVTTENVKYTSIALDPSGLPVVAYHARNSQDLQILQCSNLVCDGNNRIIVADTDDDVGYWISLVLDGDGYPVVSYYDLTNGELNILRCQNALCGIGDWDGDGCQDDAELQANPETGGGRDPKNPWDFFDVAGYEDTTDGQVDLLYDILSVVNHYSPTGAAPYNAHYDRGPSSGPNAWNMTAPDGVIDLLNDILGAIRQYGHRCT